MFNYRRIMERVMSSIHEDSRQQLISMRKEAGLTQSELAKRLIPSCTQATVSRWEDGSSSIPFKHYIAFCIACGVDIGSYISDESEQTKANQSNVNKLAD